MPAIIIHSGCGIVVVQSVHHIAKELICSGGPFAIDRRSQYGLVPWVVDISLHHSIDDDRFECFLRCSRILLFRHGNLRYCCRFRPVAVRERLSLAAEQFNHGAPQRVAGEHVGLGVVVVMITRARR